MQIGRRLLLAFRTFFTILRNGAVPIECDESRLLNNTQSGLSHDTRSAIQLLGALQREGRLVDFLMEEIEGASDADIGVAARVIHRGCKQVLDNFFELAPAYPGSEGHTVTIEAGCDPMMIELVGMTGEAPFTGTLNHQGWRIRKTQMPSLTAAFSETLLQRA